ncbi:hypothetical protein [Sphingopyxis kveilinensis]|uniref:hypothetical protein n=1 Tax=Sphingopyxis kveilinensis TaxID=3114367 RepID=UPI0030D253BF
MVSVAFSVEAAPTNATQSKAQRIDTSSCTGERDYLRSQMLLEAIGVKPAVNLTV